MNPYTPGGGRAEDPASAVALLSDKAGRTGSPADIIPPPERKRDGKLYPILRYARRGDS